MTDIERAHDRKFGQRGNDPLAWNGRDDLRTVQGKLVCLLNEVRTRKDVEPGKAAEVADACLVLIGFIAIEIAALEAP